MSRPGKRPSVAVVGLSHLGCVLAAAWSRLGHAVVAVDFDEDVVEGLRRGEPPIFEPGLAEALTTAAQTGTLAFSTDPGAVSGSPYVFLSYDTPVLPDDRSDLTLLYHALDAILPHLPRHAILIVSSQLPVGTARELRANLRGHDPTLDIAYSPENLRLGDAIRCYLEPGHVIIGCDSDEVGRSVSALFDPVDAHVVTMDLASAEMAKHCINTFLATSVTLANQWADICGAMGADYADVAAAIKLDHRIGPNAYLTPGLGFSGGTLGRDLQVLNSLHEARAVDAPLFGQIWRYNASRPGVVKCMLEEVLGDLKSASVCLLGMTYKAGTSTLRRSVALQVAEELASEGCTLTAYDPQADWQSTSIPGSLSIAASPYDAARGADAVVLLTEWPEFRTLDYGALLGSMKGSLLVDTKGLVLSHSDDLAASGWTVVQFGRSRAGERAGRG